MTLRIYNTLTRTKEAFAPLDPNNVRMYVCGPTVYDFAHIGNARPVIVFDVLYRLLRHLYGAEHVRYVRNITDVDDKINARALERFPGVPLNEAIRKVTETTANQFFADAKALGCLEPDVQPRATEHIAGMIEMISALIKKGNAYVAATKDGGEVLFDVGSMPDYGKLSQRKLEDQQAGARVAVEAHKKNPADFVLWKLSSADEPGWDSPWGRGRPGWHIECSVMSMVNLGEVFDIHGGGLDLIFPHHENEIAQSRCAHGTSVMANYWMHNGFLQVEGQKMSKSLGNFVTIADVLKDWSGEVARFSMLRTHYRQPIDWKTSSLVEAKLELSRWANFLSGTNAPSRLNLIVLAGIPLTLPSSFVEPLCDDLNISNCITVMRGLFEEAREGNSQATEFLMNSAYFLGILNPSRLTVHNPYPVRTGPRIIPESLRSYLDKIQIASANYDRATSDSLVSALESKGVSVTISEDGSVNYEVQQLGEVLDSVAVDQLISARLTARAAKDWKESDRIRDELLAMGIQIMDKRDPDTGELKTEWEVKR